MKIILTLLLVLAVGSSGAAQVTRSAAASQTKSKIKTAFNPEMLALMLDDLTLPRLRKLYGKAVQIKSITSNKHEPATRDTLLTVATKADRLEFFANKYNQFLRHANITSQLPTFGKGIRLGASKSAFCEAYGLPVSFDAYQVIDEAQSSLCFMFRQGVLAEVTYNARQAE